MADIMEFKGKIELKDDIKTLREELVRLVEERDNLIYTTCPNIKMRYMDEKAIRVETLKKEKIGYVPRGDNAVFSRLMDAGKELYAKIKEKEIIDEWLRIEIDIYLKD